MYLFSTDYTDFDQEKGPFDSDKFICKSKEIDDGNSNLWHQKYFIPCAKLLGFLACRVMPKSSVLVLPDDIGVT